MAAARLSIRKSLCSYASISSGTSSCRQYNSSMDLAKFVHQTDATPLFAYINCHSPSQNLESNGFHAVDLKSTLGSGMHNWLLRFHKRNASFAGFSSAMLTYRSYSSSSGSQGNSIRGPEVPAASGRNSSDVGLGGNDWVDKAKEIWQSTLDAVTYTGQKAKEASVELSPHVHQFLDLHPYLRDIVVPVGGTLFGTLLAWVVLPRVLRRFYKYAIQGPATILSGNLLWGPTSYEKSIWAAMEDPLRYLITFMAFSQIAMMVAPTTLASQYIGQAWRGAIILSFVWFLQRWKTNVISRAMAVKSTDLFDRDKLVTLDKISSVALLVIGAMALAEACGVAVQSILTVGGIGGVATAFAARDILGNILSGLSVQISHPFSVGDTIKAGSVEGQVVEMGLTSTSLLSAERYPVIVPNSLFSSQVIVNKSRAQWHALVNKIPVQIDNFDKIPRISDDIKSMLSSHGNVFLGKEVPYCVLSQIERSYAELTLGYNLKHMRKDELLVAQQDILLQSVRIIRQHGASLGRTDEFMVSQ